MKMVLLALLVQDPTIDRLLSDLEADAIDVREKAAAALVDLGGHAELEIKRRLGSRAAEHAGWTFWTESGAPAGGLRNRSPADLEAFDSAEKSRSSKSSAGFRETPSAPS